ncbi:hypothetical protein DUI87_06603 [Hirundo rustica rustica]|uniref:RNase H type-1 domain-containing protein n=1 Tax=Hirundo rustica rustica TaxID=333673 RepID=A0A3M0KYU9_HIRRU|nr:hypothetical protein DUI87_06603 [Hirundo rustica rustica]
MFECLLQGNANLQLSLDSYSGQISVHASSHKLFNEEFHLIPREKRSRRPLKALTVFTDAFGVSHKSVMTWRNPQTQHWEADVEFVERSPQVAELATLMRAFEKFSEPINLVTDSAYVAGVVSRAEQEKPYLPLNLTMSPVQVIILLMLSSLPAVWIVPQPRQNIWGLADKNVKEGKREEKIAREYD